MERLFEGWNPGKLVPQVDPEDLKAIWEYVSTYNEVAPGCGYSQNTFANLEQIFGRLIFAQHHGSSFMTRALARKDGSRADRFRRETRRFRLEHFLL